MPTPEDYPEDGGFGDDDVGGSLSDGCEGQQTTEPDTESVCDCIGGSVARIADAQEFIANLLNESLQAPCNSIDDCTDKILEKIKQRIEGPIYATSECQRLIQAGKQGTLEFAIRCADQVASKCETICSPGDPTSEGKCCDSCGQPNCVCQSGECIPRLPAEQPPEESAGFAGYCNSETGLILVLPVGSNPPAGFTVAGIGKTESEARAIAESFCSAGVRTTTRLDLPRPSPSTSIPCDLRLYTTGGILDALSSAIAESNFEAGGQAILNAVSDIGIAGLTLGDIGSIIQGLFSGVTKQPLLQSSLVSPYLAAMFGCTDTRWEGLFNALSSATTLASKSGVDITEWTLPYRYAMNQLCPQRHLTPEQALTAFLGDTIDGQTLGTIWKMHGVCGSNIQDYVKSVRRKPEILQLAVMRHRQIISESDFAVKMRELGFLDPLDSERLFETTKQVPVLSDILRFMVRDADDESLVARFGLDTEFANKYRSQLKQWARDQGIPDIYAQYAWRAHWMIPSPTQLFEFYHRLRDNPKFGGQGKLLDDIKAALVQQDILPYWHEHYLAVSFRPMRLRDLRRSFQIGSLTEKELLDGYVQLGYSDATAKQMQDYTIRLRDNSIIGSDPVKQWSRFLVDRPTAANQLRGDGYPDAAIDRAFERSTAKLATSDQAKAFIKGLLTGQQFLDLLISHGVDPAAAKKLVDALAVRRVSHVAIDEYAVGTETKAGAVQRMIDAGFNDIIATTIVGNVDAKVEQSFVVACQRAIKRKFIMGEIDQNEAKALLAERKTTAERADIMVSWWGCELKSGRREVSANKLCQWLAAGSIRPTQFLDRLEKIGYDRTDAELMMADCLTAENEKRAREAAKLAKQEAAASEKLQRKSQQTAAMIQRERIKMDRLREVKNKLKLSREKALYAIIDKLNGKIPGDLAAVAHFVSNQVSRIDRQFAVSQDQALQILVLAANEFSGGSQSKFEDIADAIAETTVKAELSDEPKQVFLPGGNGQAN